MEYNFLIEEPYILENDNFIVYSSQSLREFSLNCFNNLTLDKKRILDFFGLTTFRKVTIVLYDNVETFRNFIYSLRGEKESLPKYAMGTFDRGMLISYVNLKEKEELKSKKSIHEYVHVVNKEAIYQKRVTWLDEGLAVYLSNEKDYLNNPDEFKDFFNKKILAITELPIMNNLNWDNFKTEIYNGYDLSYLCVRYLIETMSDNDFQKMLRSYDLSLKTGENILNEAINYFQNKQEKILKG